MIILDIFLLLIAIALIVKGADWFVEAAVAIAEVTGVPKAVIGATIVSVATTMPEITVSFISACLGKTDIAVGNILGSVICNIGLAFGLVVVLSTISVQRKIFLEQGILMVVAGAILFVLCLFPKISFSSGILLLALFVGYVLYSIRRAGTERRLGMEEYLRKMEKMENIPTTPDPKTLKKKIVFFIMGAILVVGGSRLLIYSGVRIAETFSISERVIALTMMAVGTSLPEIVTCITSVVKGHHDISFGTVIGANIIDMTLALGLSVLVNPLTIASGTRYFDLPVMLLLIILMVLFGRTKNIFHRWEGVILLLIYLAYVIILFIL